MAERAIKSDFRKLAEAFERYPKATRLMITRQLKIAVRDIKEHASKHHRYTTRSGVLERDGVIGSVDGAVAFVVTNPSVPYAFFVHEGTPPHVIVPRNRRVLRWSKRAGDGYIFAKRVNHPGTKPDNFLVNAVDAELPRIQSRFENALDQLLEGL